MTLPRVQIGVISSILTEIDPEAAQHDTHWTENMFTRLKIDNPVMADYIATARENHGEQAALTGLLVYRMIEAQAEVEQLEELFDEKDFPIK